ncbi:MAG: hypothetical protein Q7S27_04235 [Nanoarchaeota archaeon]|nr:hypothetical protein [Nanoarchaeota archaeon]
MADNNSFFKLKYIIYGVIFILFGLEIFILLLNNMDLELKVINIGALVFALLPLLIGIIYIMAGIKKEFNSRISLSLNIGFIPLLILVFFIYPSILYEELNGVVLFPENYLVSLLLPIISYIFLGISLIILIFSKSPANNKTTKI